MADWTQIQDALRARLLTLSVATSGAINIEVANGAFVRSTGSFIADGFEVGMEITTSGFSTAGNNVTDTIKEVSATSIKVRNASLVTEAVGTRTIAAGLPALRAWENLAFKPEVGRVYIEESLMQGPAPAQVESGNFGQLEFFPMYTVRVHVPEGVGPEAGLRYATALCTLFAPRTSMTLANGDFLRVPPEQGAYSSGQPLRARAGWETTSIAIPLWLRTQNSI